jgi:DNA-binding NtrC family response regulator
MSVILIIDDDRTQRMISSQHLSLLGHTPEEAESGRAALARLADSGKDSIDLVLLDFFMPELDGKETLQRIRQFHPHLPVIMLTADNEVEHVVSAMQLGASDYITKPFTAGRLRLSIENLLTIKTLSGEVARLKRKEEGRVQFGDLIGAQGGLSACVATARKAAGSDIPVLLTGESGVGKELLARAIHGESPRGGQNFVAINCGAIPENLVESTLFGHEKGSFTGAIARELGKFREADGSTLLLDEVGELKPDMQTKLLRVLQQKEIQPVGAGKPVKVNVRILSATNRNLAEDVQSGRFRQDLYYRLNVFPIHMPSLKERRADIAMYAEQIVARFCAGEQKPLLRISRAGLKWLEEQSWPGNVRELENLLFRAVVLADKEEIDASDFAAMTQNYSQRLKSDRSDFHVTLIDRDGRTKTWEQLESEIIDATLWRCGNDIPKTAKLLQMGQSTLYKKLSNRPCVQTQSAS